MEAFHGHYKDGTNGTWDFRIVSTLYLSLRVFLVSSFLNSHSNSNHALVWLNVSIALLSISLFFAPYKVYFNAIDKHPYKQVHLTDW